ncbi:MAG: DUF3054 domain-containing protein [Chloroflexota bacterium]|nr:MAG: DUF3054 domain-containing protein [Chloroflexota bacterium]
MKQPRFTREQVILLIGDILTLALVTLLGFATHEELTTAGPRMLTTFFPLLLAWVLVAPHLQAFSPQAAADLRQIWRPFWAMILAAPLAAWLRGVMLGSVILPVFVVVIAGTSSLAILIWRGIYAFIATRKKWLYG